MTQGRSKRCVSHTNTFRLAFSHSFPQKIVCFEHLLCARQFSVLRICTVLKKTSTVPTVRNTGGGERERPPHRRTAQQRHLSQVRSTVNSVREGAGGRGQLWTGRIAVTGAP